jgi:hypothetical protein
MEATDQVIVFAIDTRKERRRTPALSSSGDRRIPRAYVGVYLECGVLNYLGLVTVGSVVSITRA